MVTDLNGSMVFFNNFFFADGEAHSGSFIGIAPVQSLEGLENFISIFFVDPDSIILDQDFNHVSFFPGIDTYNRRDILPVVFEGVCQQALKYLFLSEKVPLPV